MGHLRRAAMPDMTARGAGIATIIAFLALLAFWHLWWLPPERVPAWFALTLHALPLLPGIVLLLRRRRGALLISALGALILFSHGVMEAWAVPTTRTVAMAEIGLALLLIGAACWSGLRHRWARAREV